MLVGLAAARVETQDGSVYQPVSEWLCNGTSTLSEPSWWGDGTAAEAAMSIFGSTASIQEVRIGLQQVDRTMYDRVDFFIWDVGRSCWCRKMVKCWKSSGVWPQTLPLPMTIRIPRIATLPQPGLLIFLVIDSRIAEASVKSELPISMRSDHAVVPGSQWGGPK